MDVNTSPQYLLDATRNDVACENHGAAIFHLSLLVEQLVEQIRVLRVGE